jgi:hypothetical protein
LPVVLHGWENLASHITGSTSTSHNPMGLHGL